MSESESGQKKNGQLAATLFMEAPVRLQGVAQQQPATSVPVSTTPCLTIRKINEPLYTAPEEPASEITPQTPVALSQSEHATTPTSKQTNSLLAFLRTSAYEHPFLFGVFATVVIVSIASIPFILYIKL